MTARDIPAALASRFVDPQDLPWEKTRYPGIEQKVLLVDQKTGLFTALMRGWRTLKLLWGIKKTASKNTSARSPLCL